MKTFNNKWHYAWLYKGFKLNMITKDAIEELQEYMQNNSEIDFEQLLEDFNNNKISAYYYTNNS